MPSQAHPESPDPAARKRHKEIRTRLEDSLRLVVKAANVGLFDWDMETGKCYYSPEWKRQIGYQDHEIRDHIDEWSSRVHPEDMEWIRRDIERFVKNPWPDYQSEFRFRHKNGEYRWILVQATVHHGAGGKPRMFGAHVDITERKRAEEALKRSEDRYRRLAEQSPIGISRTDASGANTYVNPRLAEISGYPPEQQLGYQWHAIIHEDDRERAVKNWEAAFMERTPIEQEMRLRRSDGEVVWIIANGQPEFDDQGKFLGYIGTFRDVTEIKRAELALRANEERFHAMVESSPLAVFLTNPEGDVTYNNPANLRLLGLSYEDALGNGWAKAVHPKDRERAAFEYQAAMRRGLPWKGSCRFLHKDDRVKWCEVTTAPVRVGGRLLGHVGMASDVTERRRTERELRRSESFRRLIFETEPECIKLVDPDGRLLEMNPAGLAMIEADSIEQVAGIAIAEVVAPEDRDAYRDLHQRVMKGDSGHLEFDVIGLKGARRRLETHAVPLRDEDKRIIALLGVARDVTQSRRAEKVLQDSEVRYRSLFEQNPNCMCVYDVESLRFLAVNDAMVRHYGYSREEFLSMTLKDIRPPEDIPALLEAVKRTTSELSFAGIFRHRKKTGEMIDVEVRSHITEIADRKGVLGMVTDVTERLKAEAALAQEQAVLRETTARLNHLLTTSPTILYSTRLHRGKVRPIWISESVTRLLGYTREEALQPDWWPNHLHPDNREMILGTLPTLLERGFLVNEYRFLKKDGQPIWIRDEARVLSQPGGEQLEVVGTWSDITQRRKTEERLRLDAAAFESTRDGVLITNLEGVILSVNRSFREATGYQEGELLGKKPSLLQSGRHASVFYRDMWNSLEKSGQWQGEIWNRRKNGELFPEWLTISTVSNEQGEPTHYVAIYTDISKLKQSEEELEHLAHFDPLTDLPNRLLLQSRLDHAVDQARRRGRNVAVLFIDLDDFKKVNDSLGHLIGDELLVAVAQRLKTRVRGEDTLARQGGDEFVVLLEEIQRAEEAAMVARDLRASLSSPCRLQSGHELYVQASIGISIFPDDSSSPAELLRDADTAMYRAKEGGGDRFLFFTPDMSVQVMAALELENALRQALDRRELLLYFQPKIDLHSGRISGAEALLRWRRADSHIVSPAEFIPVAEKTGLIVPIGEWVIDTACGQLKAWRDEGVPDIQVAVNVSARQFRSGDLESAIASSLAKHGVPAHLLALELTESILMEQPEEAIEILRRLKQIGISLSLDDFGTGFSSLAYLTRFPVDSLKIDAAFVRDVETDPAAMTVVNSVIELAHRMGMLAVAEGVETKRQYAYVKGRGCDAMQGFLYSKPLPVDQFTQLLREGTLAVV